MNEIDQKSLALHKEKKGKIALQVKTPITSREDLSLAYTPGVAAPCREIADHETFHMKFQPQESFSTLRQSIAPLYRQIRSHTRS